MPLPNVLIDLVAGYAAVNRVDSFVEGVPCVDSSVWNSCAVWCDPDAVDACIARGFRDGSTDLGYFVMNPMAIDYLRANLDKVRASRDPNRLLYNPRGLELWAEMIGPGAEQTEIHKNYSEFRASLLGAYDPLKPYSESHHAANPPTYRLVPELSAGLLAELLATLG